MFCCCASTPTKPWSFGDAARGANAPRPGQRGANAPRPGQRGANAPRPGQRGANAPRPGQRGANAPRPGQRGANAPRPGQRGANAPRPGRQQRTQQAAAQLAGAAEAPCFTAADVPVLKSCLATASLAVAVAAAVVRGVAFHNPRDNAFGVAIGVEKLA
eukprot:jgi/Tetstr1/433805/TSEL_022992.t1